MRQIFKTVMLAACVALLLPLTADGQVRYKLNKEKIAVQLHTNGLYDLALCPNIGLELQTDLGLAWQCDYIGAWWSNNSKHRYWQNYAFQMELRYYLGHDHQDTPYFGHHIGVYGQLATYDFEFGGTGSRVTGSINPGASELPTATVCLSVGNSALTLRSV